MIKENKKIKKKFIATYIIRSKSSTRNMLTAKFAQPFE